MSVRNWGNPPLYSTTAAIVSDPSTATLAAELILPASVTQPGHYEVRWTVGASTTALWLLEHATSSGLGSTAIGRQIAVFTGTGLSAEFVHSLPAAAGDRFRVRLNSSFTGTAACNIQAESIT